MSAPGFKIPAAMLAAGAEPLKDRYNREMLPAPDLARLVLEAALAPAAVATVWSVSGAVKAPDQQAAYVQVAPGHTLRKGDVLAAIGKETA